MILPPIFKIHNCVSSDTCILVSLSGNSCQKFSVFSGILNSFNARTHRINLFAHLAKNPSFAAVMLLVAGVQLLLIYYGGTLFRTAGLTLPELKAVCLIAFSVVPVDLARKLCLRLRRR